MIGISVASASTATEAAEDSKDDIVVNCAVDASRHVQDCHVMTGRHAASVRLALDMVADLTVAESMPTAVRVNIHFVALPPRGMGISDIQVAPQSEPSPPSPH